VEDLCERLKGMRRKEISTHYRIPDYLAPEWQARLVEEATRDNMDDSELPNPNEEISQINEQWRVKICDWCYQVVDHFDYNREVVTVAMSYLDRYIAKRTVNRRIFQLVAMTALYLATKLFERNSLHLPSLVGISRGYFLAEHIVAMEDSMLQALSWHVHPSTPRAFCWEMMRLVSPELTPRIRHDVGNLAIFLTELSVYDYYFVTRKSSSIAIACIVNAIELMGPKKIEPKYKVHFLHNIVRIGLDIADDDEIIECYERLREMYIEGGYTPTSEDEDDVDVPPDTANTNKRKRWW
jgi:lipoyl(octanoyl) transferase